ncbi:MAG: hypothetical protein JWQ15_1719, partial [Marmoricola sp.]|nr:hypothetical protein [Marmoricola sp.]
MFTRSSVASFAGLVVLVSSLSVATGVSASASPAGTVARTAAGTVVRTQTASAARVAGQPPRNYVVPSGARFAFPNRSKSERLAIRLSVLYTVQSTWGGVLDRYKLPLASNGRIRMATWSFKDMGIARALVAAKNRGVSVQVVAAQGRNEENKPWRYLKRHLG